MASENRKAFAYTKAFSLLAGSRGCTPCPELIPLKAASSVFRICYLTPDNINSRSIKSAQRFHNIPVATHTPSVRLIIQIKVPRREHIVRIQPFFHRNKIVFPHQFSTKHCIITYRTTFLFRYRHLFAAYIRKIRCNIITIFFLKQCIQSVSPATHIRFIIKHKSNITAKNISEYLLVAFVSHIYKVVCCLTLCYICTYPIHRTTRILCGVFSGLRFHQFFHGKMRLFFANFPARHSGRESTLVIQPCIHTFFFGTFISIAHKLEIFIRQIFRRKMRISHPRTKILRFTQNIKSTYSIAVHFVYLFFYAFPCNRAVPQPCICRL